MFSFLQSFDSRTFTWIILPLLIFFARICDVSIGTLRIIFVSRGNKLAAPLLGFFEVLIWLTAIGKIMQNLDNIMAYVAYGGGFAMGNFIGIWIEQKLAVGLVILRVITRKDAAALSEDLRSRGFGVTCIDAEGNEGPVNIVYSVLKRSALGEAIGLVEKMNPGAFYSIEDVRAVSEGIFPHTGPFAQKKYLKLLRNRRKGK
ncbi:MAG: DUF2179 domain-containing protein [Spirochaetes bacterium]|jgi:uncharacterized protein YebE (UPF0316 family)|nr:DUF2179 domain-containing protein [Spirochaetota bacterium]